MRTHTITKASSIEHAWGLAPYWTEEIIKQGDIYMAHDHKQVWLMNPFTGSVDSAENWLAEGYGLDDGLIEVAQDEGGDWYEVE